MNNNISADIIYAKLELVKKEIYNTLMASPMLVRMYIQHLLKSQGKYIRTYSILATAIDKENKITDEAIRASAAVELIHLASLVHDDVIDNADLRRGEETLQKKYGQKTAVICGDYIFATAISLFSNVVMLTEYKLLDYARQLALGELNQHINNNNYDLDVDTYFSIIDGKTAKLFEASFLIGATLAKESKENIEVFKNIGNKLGLIFQLIDDCNNFSNTLLQAKKPVLSDFEDGVITLPLIYAFKNNPQALKDAKNGKLNSKDVRLLVTQAKGVERTKDLTQKYYNEIILQLNSIKITEFKKQQIMLVLNRIMSQ